ncbi:hypothetical protein OG21DRAFT_1009516 [Imleria badia]|nr:hypothetical protein OG21DRAFT_1009516 [Imleria badia]
MTSAYGATKWTEGRGTSLGRQGRGEQSHGGLDRLLGRNWELRPRWDVSLHDASTMDHPAVENTKPCVDHPHKVVLLEAPSETGRRSIRCAKEIPSVRTNERSGAANVQYEKATGLPINSASVPNVVERRRVPRGCCLRLRSLCGYIT